MQEPAADIRIPSVNDLYITAAVISRDGKHLAYATAR